MLSVIVPVRNTRQMAANCLSSLLSTVNALRLRDRCQFILMDDDSDAAQQIPDLFREFRAQADGADVTLLRFRKRTHYTGACAVGLSAAKGSHVLLLSHDMVMTPDYLRTLLAVSALDPSFGIVRGTSNYVDCFPQYTVRPTLPIRSLEDVNAFSRYVSQALGLTVDEHHLLTGDSVLITRPLLDKVGVFDTRYFGYFGDIDFGLRAQRAGFKMVCAAGAWLFHEGAGHYKDQAATTNTDMQVVHNNRMQVVNAAYKEFRNKWDPTMPENYSSSDALPLQRLRAARIASPDYQPPVPVDPAAVEVL